MDKYEFNIKVEQLKKMAKMGDYETAMRIANSIDWSRVHNTSLLSVVSEVYEKNTDYSEAKEILLLAYERGSKGKRSLYKLTILSLKEGEVDEAEEFYQEFYEAAPEDPRNYVLRYLILKEKQAPLDQMIYALEKYNSLELDEEWMFELAQLYHQAGRSDECVKTCDNIMLMFGLGKYVDSAIELKTKKEGKPLTEYQQGLLDSRNKYGERLKDTTGLSEDMIYQQKYQEIDPRYAEEEEEETQEDFSGEIQRENIYHTHESLQEEEDYIEDSDEIPLYQNASYDESSLYENHSYEEQAQEYEETLSQDSLDNTILDSNSLYQENQYESIPENEEVEEHYSYDEEPKDTMYIGSNYMSNMEEDMAYMSQLEEMAEEEKLRNEIKNLEGRMVEVEDSENDKTKILANIKAALAVREQSSVIYADANEDVDVNLSIEDIEDLNEEEVFYFSAFVEANAPENGLELALNKLKEIYLITGIQKRVSKIKGSKLNARGMMASSEKIKDKDLIIEEANDLDATTIDEIIEVAEESNKSFIFIDTSDRIAQLKEKYPQLFKICGGSPKKVVEVEVDDFEDIETDFIASEENPLIKKEIEDEKKYEEESKSIKSEKETIIPNAVEMEEIHGSIMEEDSQDANKYEESEEEYPIGEIEEEIDPMMEEELDIETFVAYADEYATKIDCTIPGKSMPALYERAEIMEEDGIILNRLNAEALIEEAADRAEKPPILRKLVSIFSQTYDKKGFLILKEEHFIS